MANEALSFPSHNALSIFDDCIVDNDNNDCLHDPFSPVRSPSNLNRPISTQPNPPPSVTRPLLPSDGPVISSHVSTSNKTAGPSNSGHVSPSRPTGLDLLGCISANQIASTQSIDQSQNSTSNLARKPMYRKPTLRDGLSQ